MRSTSLVNEVSGLVDRDIEQTDSIGWQDSAGARNAGISRTATSSAKH
jgi:hypothetical protein